MNFLSLYSISHYPTAPGLRYDPALTVETTTTIVIQVNGKLRGTLDTQRGSLASDIESLAQAQISKWLIGKEIKNIIYVPDTLINFIVS